MGLNDWFSSGWEDLPSYNQSLVFVIGLLRLLLRLAGDFEIGISPGFLSLISGLNWHPKVFLELSHPRVKQEFALLVKRANLTTLHR